MLKTQFTLIEKVALTHDVYELTYSCPDMIGEMPKPGQYVMFQLAPGLNRAYSIASFYGGDSSNLTLPSTHHSTPLPPLQGGLESIHTQLETTSEPLPSPLKGGLETNPISEDSRVQESESLTYQGSRSSTFTLIIKRITDGRGSPIICDAEVGTTFSGMLPLGHFTLRENTKSKCFIGTGTGFAPLYCQMLACTQGGIQGDSALSLKIAFVFGVRNFVDDFYETEIREIGQKFTHFTHVHYFSRESEFPQVEESKTQKLQYSGYVTDWLTEDNVAGYEEFYICGSPAMVKSARETLEALGVLRENIFFEQF